MELLDTCTGWFDIIVPIILVICCIKVKVKFAPNVGLCPTASNWLVFSLFNKVLLIEPNKDEFNDDSYYKCWVPIVLFCKIQRYYSDNSYVVCHDVVRLVNPVFTNRTYRFKYTYIYIQKDINSPYDILDLYKLGDTESFMEHSARKLARKILYDYTIEHPFIKGQDHDSYLYELSHQFKQARQGKNWRLSHLSLSTPELKPAYKEGKLDVKDNLNTIKRVILILAIILTSINILYYLIDLMKG